MLRLIATMLLLAVPGGAPAAAAPQHIDAARVVAVARESLQQQLGDDAQRAQVATVGTPEDIQVLSGQVTLEARRSVGRWPRSRVSVPVDIYVDGRVVRSATVWFSLSVSRNVLSYANDAAAGSLPMALKFASKDADVAALPAAPIADVHELDGKRLRRNVIAGAPVLPEDFEKVPDVDRRGRVDVVASFGSIRMQTKGTSASTGNIGDLVSVLVDGAEAPVRARVTDKGVVDVVE
jgi:flagellar basal body P-ring formation protein FlgA